MSIVKKLFFIVFVVLSGSASVQGQAVRSPFSTYGIGDVYGNSLVHNQGMGGVGISQPQYWFVNNQNPALLVHNLVTVFQAGAIGESRTIRGDTLREKSQGGNLNYLVTAFPIIPHTRNNYKSKWSTSLGLMPYSTINYGLVYSDIARDQFGAVSDTVNIRESGSGGLTQFYWSNGISISKNLSAGVKAAYLFGPMETSYESVFKNQTTPYIIQVTEKTNVKDFLFTLGLAFSDTLNRKHGYHIGATYTPGTNLKATRRADVLRFVGGSIQALDTVNLFQRRGDLKIPTALGLGFSFFRMNKWTIGTEFNYQDWSSFKSINEDDEGLGKNWRAALGGEFTPDLFDENFLKRITYRMGVNFEKYPFIVNGNQVDDFGINFGFSIPASRSSLDLAFKVGKRGDRAQNVFEETYFKVYFGITFNDKWFIKRKFD